MKCFLSFLVILGLVAGTIQAGVIMDASTNNGSFELSVNTGDASENEQRTLGSEGWTKDAGSGWNMFTRSSYVPNSVSDGSWGLSVNAGVTTTVTSDDIAVDIATGDLLMFSFNVGNNTASGSVIYVPTLIINGTEVALESYTYASPNILGGSPIAHQTVNYQYVMAEDATTVAVKIVVNNSGSGNDQVYLDNVMLSSYKLYEINEAEGPVIIPVSLHSDPMGNLNIPVVVTPASGDDADLAEITYPASLAFNSTNWTGLNLSITSIDDTDIDGDKSYFVELTDPNAVDTAFYVTVKDDDIGIMTIIDADNITLAEGGIGTTPDNTTIQVQIIGTSTADVTVTLEDTADTDQVTFSTDTLVFTPAETAAGTAKPVTITAIDEDATEALTHSTVVTVSVSSADSSFEAIAAQDISIDILENDCGADGFEAYDFDQNCIIDLADLKAFMGIWLDCYLPNATPGDCQ